MLQITSSSSSLAWALSLAPLVFAGPIGHGNLNDAKAYDMPLTWTPFGFITDAITLGTPPQRVPSFVDWTWIGQYAFSPLCHGDPSRTSECLHPDQAYWNQYTSSTFRNESQQYPEQVWNPNHFFFYDDLATQFGKDIIEVGPLKADILVQVADTHWTQKFAFPFHGVFGMSPVFPTDNATTQSAFWQIWKNGGIENPVTSFFECYNGTSAPPKSACNGADAVQTLGGIRWQNIKGRVTWYDNIHFPPVNDYNFQYSPAIYNYFASAMTSVKIGNEVQALNETYEGKSAAIWDHASYGRGAPLSLAGYERLIQITGAEPIVLEQNQRPNNGNQSDFAVDCGKVTSFPPLKYAFRGNAREWSVKPENYVEKVNGACVLNIRTLGYGTFDQGNFGETFIRDKMVILDYEKLKIGVADLKW